MISETARPETQAASRQGKWILWAGRLARLMVALVTLALLGTLLAAAAPRLWGYQSYVIYGSSMEPTIKVGALTLAKPVQLSDLEVGDIIVFQTPTNGVTLTHRVVGVRQENGQYYFQTKGDASNGNDPVEVRLEDDVQRVVYDIPYLGYFVHFAKSTLGIILLIALPAAALLASSWPRQRGPKREAEADAAEAPPEG